MPISRPKLQGKVGKLRHRSGCHDFSQLQWRFNLNMSYGFSAPAAIQDLADDANQQSHVDFLPVSLKNLSAASAAADSERKDRIT
jgi:hypothetical protein